MISHERLPLLGLSFLAVIAGVWFAVSPWVLAEQAPHAPWSHDTTTHFLTGLVLVLLGVLEAYAATKRASPVTNRQASAAADPDPDPLADDRLVLLATALLRDLESTSPPPPQAASASPAGGMQGGSRP